ncbi:hypothetical protein ACVR0T_11020, partial [Streptococcus chenjunshii]
GLSQAVNQGLSEVQGDLKGFSGTFPDVSTRSMPWLQTIQTAISASNDNSKAILDDDSKAILKQAEEDKKKGLISEETYRSIWSGIISGGAAFLKELAQSKVTDVAVETFTQEALEWLTRNVQNMQFGAVGAVVGGGNYTVPINVNPAYSNFVSGAARYGAPVLGAALDFGMQVSSGEEVGDAAIKTGAHVAIGIGAAKVGASIGSSIGTLVFPGIGTVSGATVGAVAGFIVGVAGSMIFDWGYDNFKDDIVNTGEQFIDDVSQTLNEVGDAVSGFFSGLGSAFN